MMEQTRKEVGTETPKKRKKLLFWLIPAAAVVVAGAVAAVLLLGGRGADDEWLRKALAEDSVRTIELNENIKCTQGYEVNGTKTLVGTGKISMNEAGNYVFSVNTDASLTVDGITLNVKNVGSNGAVVRAGGTLIWEDGVISYPKQYAIINYGQTTINGGTFEYAGATWLYVKAGTTAAVNGGQFTKSGAAGFEVEEGATLTIGGQTNMERAGTNTVNNNGKLVMTGGAISQCETWTIANHSEATLRNVTIKDCALKGSLYNYKDATAEVEGCQFVNCKTYQIYNEGVATVKDTLLSNSNASTVNNKNEITLENVTIKDSNYHGIYNERGTVNIKNLTVDGTVYKAVQNKAGYVTIDGLTTDHIGGVGVGNVAVAAGGNYGWIHAANMHISGCQDYNFVSYGGEVSISDSTFELTPATNVYIRNGVGTLENVKVLGSTTEGKAAIACGAPAWRTSEVTISGADTYITGASRGVSNYGKLTINAGTITDNHTTGEQEVGGGVYNVGTFYMNGGTISNNSCTTYGGGVRNGTSEGHHGVMYLYGGTITGNHAGINGGGVSVGSEGTALYMYGGTISGNTADNKADGVMVAGTFDYYNGAITDNDVFLNETKNFVNVRSTGFSGKDIVVNSTSFADTGAPAVKFLSEADAEKLGGRFVCGSDQWSFEKKSNTLITRIALNDIRSDVDFAGAQTVTVGSFAQLKQAVESTSGKKIIRVTGNIPMTGLITVPRGAAVQITDNGTAHTLNRSGYKGVLFEVGNGATLALSGSAGLTVDGGSASGLIASAPLVKTTYGGMVLLQKGATLQNAVNDTYSSSDRAGAVNVYGGRLIVEGGAIRNCNAYGTNNGVTDNLAAIYVSPSSVVSIQDGVLENCKNGVIRSYGRVYLSGGTIGNNERIGDGGTAIRGTVVQMTGGTITGNKSSNSGSAVYITGSETYPNAYFRMDGGTISGNTSARTVDKNASGGAVYIGKFATFDFNAGEISGNVAGDARNGMGGGGIYAEIATVNIGKGAKITDNYAYNSGGGIFAAGTKLHIADGAVISGNETLGLATGYGGGGAIMLTNCTETATGKRFYTAAEIEGATIADNVSGNSGVIYVDADCSLTMTGTTLSGNTANGKSSSGYASASAVLNKSTLVMKDCTVKDNTAQGLSSESIYKGAVYNDGAAAKLTVTGGSFTGNVATGAAALCNAGGTAAVTGTTFSGNTAVQPNASGTSGGNGGAVMNQSVTADSVVYPGTLTLTDCTFSDNTATARAAGGGGEGGAIYNDRATLNLKNTTFTGNTARVGQDILNSSNSVALNVDGTLDAREIYLAVDHPLTLGGDFRAASAITLSLPASAYHQGTTVLTGNVNAETAAMFTLDTESALHVESSGEHAGQLSDGSAWVAVAKIGDEVYYSLNSAITAAQEGDTITLVNDVELSGELQYKKVITITTDGQDRTIKAAGDMDGFLLHAGSVTDKEHPVKLVGAGDSKLILDGNGHSLGKALLCMDGTNMELENVVIRNGKQVTGTNTHSAGLYLTGGNCTATNVTFEDNEADNNYGGGAVYLTGTANFYATDCAFTDNTTTLGGGAIYASSNTTVELTNCTFSGNAASGTSARTDRGSYKGYGGAVYFNGATLTVDGCTFATNTASVAGNDLYVPKAATALTVKNSTFDRTQGAAVGGSASLTGEGNTFAEVLNYEARIGEVSYETLAEAIAAAQEGDTVVLLSDVELSARLNIGKAITLTTDGQDRTVKAAADINDFLLYLGTGSGAASQYTVTLKGEGDSKLILDGNGHTLAKSLLCMERVDLKLENAVIRDGKQTTNGNSHSAGLYLTNGNCTAKNVTFENNEADNNYGGGAVYLTGTANFYATDCTFTGNTAALGGGAIYASSNTTVELTNCTFTDNTASGTSAKTGRDAYKGYGGAVYFNGATLTVDGCTFETNTASVAGNDLYVPKAATVLTVKNSTFDKAASSAIAGNATYTGTGNAFETTASDTKAARIGEVSYETLAEAIAAAQTGDTIVLLSDVELSARLNIGKAVTLTTDGQDRTIKAAADIGDFLLYLGTGSGAASQYTVTLKGEGDSKLILDGNGHTLAKSLLCMERVDLKLENAVIRNGKQTTTGNSHSAGLYLTNGNCTAKNVAFDSNEADNNYGGGAVYLTGTAKLYATDCTFAGNTATLGGGAIYAAGNATMELTGCTFIGNTASGETTRTNRNAYKGYGGAVYFNGATLTVDGCTFATNTASVAGSDLYVPKAATVLTVKNSTFDKAASSAIAGSATYTNTNNTFAS